MRGAPSVCFVHSPCDAVNDDRLEPPLGILYLAGVARDEGCSVRVIDLASRGQADLAAEVPVGFDVYGFSTYTVNFRVTLALADAVRVRNPRALFIAGGPHATALPEEVLAAGFDAVVTGEGETALAAIVRAVRRGERPRGIVRGTPVADLDTLTFPDYDLLDFGTYSRELDGQRCVSVLSSRGCPYPCTFCNSRIMGAGTPIRYRSPENVVAEVRQIKARGIDRIRFQDDIFTLDIRRVRRLAAALSREGVIYRCFSRVSTFTAEMAALVRGSGCIHVSFGVESGSPALLAEHAMNKHQTPGDIRAALEHARAAGLRTRVYLMVGFPGETDGTVRETIELMKSTPWDEFAVYPLIAYPGTPLFEEPERFGILQIRRDYGEYVQVGRDFRAGFTIRTATFDERQVRVWRDAVVAELLADGRTWAGAAVGFR